MYNYVAETEIDDIHVISVRGTVCLFVCVFLHLRAYIFFVLKYRIEVK